MATFTPKPESASEQRASGIPQGDLCFMETQFPVSKMSLESYSERMANASQTLTGLGKWWGRKPLVLCRATILGLLMPATGSPEKDRDVFLRLMTMDDDGMLRRKSKRLPAALVAERVGPTAQQRHFVMKKNRKGQDALDYRPSATAARQRELFRKAFGKNPKAGTLIDATAVFTSSCPEDRATWFSHDSTESHAEFYVCPKAELERAAFLSLSYGERLEYCDRSEQIDGPSAESWDVINSHFGTTAQTLPELVRELGERRFGHTPRVGDSFSGGGSIPFEAARLGCDAYGSDLNPVAALLTWASLNIVGGGPDVAEEVREAQRRVYEAVDRQVTKWGIEHSDRNSQTGRRWRADSYLYCAEATCPECGWRIPLAPSWFVGKGSNTIVRLVADRRRKRFDFEVCTGVSDQEAADAEDAGTAKDGEFICPGYKSSGERCASRTPIKAIRGDGRGTFGESRSLLRGWENDEVIPREDDIFGERIYCIRWEDTWTDDSGKTQSDRYYRAPTAADLLREQQVQKLLGERFDDWQRKGYIPSRKIEPGAETTRLQRERGWTYWHHLFTPRQLLVNGLLSEEADGAAGSKKCKVALLLGVGRCADWGSRLCRWNIRTIGDKSVQTFSNQALNTLCNYATRALPALHANWFARIADYPIQGTASAIVCDGRAVSQACDVWITDPPYADAVNYEEISELFLAWYHDQIPALFPNWYADSKRALAIKGNEDGFRSGMVDSYRRMVQLMPDDGFQVVMFTHQDAGVWADLALILWAAGLRVTAAWCISTETDSPLKKGNYVQGTVLLVLRKQIRGETAFLDEVYQEVEAEVHRQLDSMKDLDDAKDPNFGDTDYQLAAYAAALRVLTSRRIEEIDVAYELTKKRERNEKSPVEEIIEKAVRIACDHLVPRGLDPHLWKSLTSLERLYVKGLELESHGERRSGVFQELARGFGVDEYTPLMASSKANEARLKTASEFGRREMGEAGFGASLVRHALFAACKTAETESTRDGITWLTSEVKDYASSRGRLLGILEFLASLRQNASMAHWHKDAQAAGLLAGALRNRDDNV